MASFWKVTLVLSAGVLAATQAEPTLREAPVCSGFSEEQDHRDPRLSWRFRSCTTEDSRREVQTQFSNRSNRAVTFEYRLWTHATRNCRTDEPAAAQGVRTLGPNQTEDWPYTVSTLAANAEFNGRIWICVREVAR